MGRRHRDLKPGGPGGGPAAAYGWNGAAWHVMAMPRVFLTRPPWLAVAASGEAWLVGAGTKRVHRQSIILYRMGGTWKTARGSRTGLASRDRRPVPSAGLSGFDLALQDSHSLSSSPSSPVSDSVVSTQSGAAAPLPDEAVRLMRYLGSTSKAELAGYLTSEPVIRLAKFGGRRSRG